MPKVIFYSPRKRGLLFVFGGMGGDSFATLTYDLIEAVMYINKEMENKELERKIGRIEEMKESL